MKRKVSVQEWKCLDCDFVGDTYADLILHQKQTGHKICERKDRRILGVTSGEKPARIVKAI
jgi:hypothetical protein